MTDREPLSAAYDPLWWQLRQEETEVAHFGYGRWSEFVRRCERQLGLPWDTIRREFDRIPLAGNAEAERKRLAAYRGALQRIAAISAQHTIHESDAIKAAEIAAEALTFGGI